MKRNQQSLIDDLTADLKPVRALRPVRLAASLWALTWLSAIVLTLLTGPLRPGVAGQLTGSPQFAIESFVGLLAGGLFALAAAMLAVPGRHGTRWFGIAAVALAAWVGAYVIGLYAPALEPSMLGKRGACYLEVFVFAVPTLAWGRWALRRGYVLDGWLAGAALGTVAGAAPALLMQLACMYETHHILIYHLGPVVLTALVGAWLGHASTSRR